MNSKQRVLNSLNGLDIDRIPVDMFEGGSIYPDLIKNRLMSYFNVSNWDDVLIAVKSDLRWLNAAVYRGPKKYTPDGRETNEFGAIELAYSPWKEVNMDLINSYDWPDPSDWDYTGLREQALKYSDYAICAPYIPTMLFSRTAELMGMEEALICMYTEPKVYDALVAKIFEYSYGFMKMY
ncbi:MAG TPA: hypothetical protein GXX14_06220 [Clostridiaceae bacterium]|nr:hypothetical protein [Clostridiaceae bacterium]